MSPKPSARPFPAQALNECIGKDTNIRKVRVPYYHVLQKGETLYRLSRIYGVSLNEIYYANEVTDPNDLPVGTRILIPGVRHTSPRLRWPLHGRLTSGFGPRRRGRHFGIDLAANSGTTIRASAGGLVIASASSLKGYSRYGKIVIIQHREGLITLYAHNSKNLVARGQCVRAGQPIAEVGRTGNATGPHLHFEVRRNGLPQNPLYYLP